MSYIQMESGAASLKIANAIAFYRNKMLNYENGIAELTKPVDRKFLWFKWTDNGAYDTWDRRIMFAKMGWAACEDNLNRLNVLLRMCNNAPSIKLSVKDFLLIDH